MIQKCKRCGKPHSSLSKFFHICSECLDKMTDNPADAAKSREFIGGKPGLKKDKKRRKEHNG
jgi:hypothetical protein